MREVFVLMVVVMLGACSANPVKEEAPVNGGFTAEEKADIELTSHLISMINSSGEELASCLATLGECNDRIAAGEVPVHAKHKISECSYEFETLDEYLNAADAYLKRCATEKRWNCQSLKEAINWADGDFGLDNYKGVVYE